MMFKSHVGETITVVLSVVMGLLMSIAVIIVDHLDFNFSNVFSIWAMITLVILIVSMFVSYKVWSQKLTGMILKETEGIAYKILDNILPSLILNTCNTVIVSAANIFYNKAIPEELWMIEWIQGIIHDWPIMFVISCLAAFIAEAVGKRVAGRYCN